MGRPPLHVVLHFKPDRTDALFDAFVRFWEHACAVYVRLTPTCGRAMCNYSAIKLGWRMRSYGGEVGFDKPRFVHPRTMDFGTVVVIPACVGTTRVKPGTIVVGLVIIILTLKNRSSCKAS